MIEVFKTNVQKISQARRMVDLLLGHFPGSKINFDLQDCDRILRVEAAVHFNTGKIIVLLKESGFACAVLE